jgi:hypothetical protein
MHQPGEADGIGRNNCRDLTRLAIFTHGQSRPQGRPQFQVLNVTEDVLRSNILLKGQQGSRAAEN